MTSSDVLDTCFNVQLTRAADILIADVDEAARGAQAPRLRAQDDADHRRSHGIHAEPVTFGLKLAQAYAEFSRARTA
jgi:adenylosuccinate lyase